MTDAALARGRPARPRPRGPRPVVAGRAASARPREGDGAAARARRLSVGRRADAPTLARHLLEETHELLEAIDADDADAIRDELGDVLLQVVFHAQMAADEGAWDVDDVARGPRGEAVHRHPHVFGEVEVAGRRRGARELGEAEGRREGRAQRSVDDDIPASLPVARARGQGPAARRRLGVRVAERRRRDRRAPRGGRRARRGRRPGARRGGARRRPVRHGRRWRASTASTPRARCGGPCARSRGATSGSSALAAERGLDVETADEAELRALFREAKA